MQASLAQGLDCATACLYMHALMLLLRHSACTADFTPDMRSGPLSAAISKWSDHKAEGIWLPRSPRSVHYACNTQRHIAATIRLHSWLTHTFCCLCITADVLMLDTEHMAAGQGCHAEFFAVRSATMNHTRTTICLRSKLLYIQDKALVSDVRSLTCCRICCPQLHNCRCCCMLVNIYRESWSHQQLIFIALPTGDVHCFLQVQVQTEAEIEELQGVLGLALHLNGKHQTSGTALHVPCLAPFTSMVPESMQLAHRCSACHCSKQHHLYPPNAEHIHTYITFLSLGLIRGVNRQL